MFADVIEQLPRQGHAVLDLQLDSSEQRGERPYLLLEKRFEAALATRRREALVLSSWSAQQVWAIQRQG